MDQADHVAKVAECAVNGERARGSGGVVLVNETSMAYVLVDEIESEELRESLRDGLSEDGTHFVYIVMEKDRQVHIWKLDRLNLVGS